MIEMGVAKEKGSRLYFGSFVICQTYPERIPLVLLWSPVADSGFHYDA